MLTFFETLDAAERAIKNGRDINSEVVRASMAKIKRAKASELPRLKWIPTEFKTLYRRYVITIAGFPRGPWTWKIEGNGKTWKGSEKNRAAARTAVIRRTNKLPEIQAPREQVPPPAPSGD